MKYFIIAKVNSTDRELVFYSVDEIPDKYREDVALLMASDWDVKKPPHPSEIEIEGVGYAVKGVNSEYIDFYLCSRGFR